MFDLKTDLSERDIGVELKIEKLFLKTMLEYKPLKFVI